MGVSLDQVYAELKRNREVINSIRSSAKLPIEFLLNEGDTENLVISAYNKNKNRTEKIAFPSFIPGTYIERSEINAAEGVGGLDENGFLYSHIIPQLPISKVTNLQTTIDEIYTKTEVDNEITVKVNEYYNLLLDNADAPINSIQEVLSQINAGDQSLINSIAEKVSYTVSQSLTTAQKTIAKTNIGLENVAYTNVNNNFSQSQLFNNSIDVYANNGTVQSYYVRNSDGNTFFTRPVQILNGHGINVSGGGQFGDNISIASTKEIRFLGNGLLTTGNNVFDIHADDNANGVGQIRLRTSGGDSAHFLSTGINFYKELTSTLGATFGDNVTISNSIEPNLILSNTKTSAWTVGDEITKLAFHIADTSGIGARNVAEIRTTANGGSSTTGGNLDFYVSAYNSNVQKILELDGNSLTSTFKGYLGVGKTPVVALDIEDSTNSGSRGRFAKGSRILELGASRDASANPYIGDISGFGFSLITNDIERYKIDGSGNHDFKSGTAIFRNTLTLATASNQGSLQFGSLNTNYQIFAGDNWGYLRYTAPIHRWDISGTQKMRLLSTGLEVTDAVTIGGFLKANNGFSASDNNDGGSIDYKFFNVASAVNSKSRIWLVSGSTSNRGSYIANVNEVSAGSPSSFQIATSPAYATPVVGYTMDSSQNNVWIGSGQFGRNIQADKIGAGIAPTYQLHVDSGSASDIARFENNNGGFVLGQTGNQTSIDLSSANAFRIRQGGNVPFKIETNGTSIFVGSVTATNFIGNINGLNSSDFVLKSDTGIGVTGNRSYNNFTNTAQKWADLPVGYSRMMWSGIGIAGGAPVNNYGYFTKIANRDGSGGWGGIWVGYSNNENYIGRSSTSSTFATWDKLLTEGNFGKSQIDSLGLNYNSLVNKPSINFDNYQYFNLKTNGVQRKQIGSLEQIDFIQGTGISIGYSANGGVNISNSITNNNQLTNGAGYITSIGSDYVKKNERNAYTKQQHFPYVHLTDGSTINWNCDNQKVIVQLEGNRIIANPSNIKNGATYILVIGQGSVGNRTVSFGNSFEFGEDGVPTLSTGALKFDILVFEGDGTKLFHIGTKRGFNEFIHYP